MMLPSEYCPVIFAAAAMWPYAAIIIISNLFLLNSFPLWHWAVLQYLADVAAAHEHKLQKLCSQYILAFC